jgi:hypothetical protein
MKLRDAHLKKLRRSEPGFAVFFERLIDSILDPMPARDGFPATLSLDDQGRFILGYHHQRSYRKPATAAAPDDPHALPEDALSDPHDDTEETEA